MAEVTPEALATAAYALFDTMIDSLTEQRDEVAGAFAIQVAESGPRACIHVSQAGEACDRSPGHSGTCSWEFETVARRYRGYEEAAARVPYLEQQNANLETQLAVTHRLLAEERLKVKATTKTKP